MYGTIARIHPKPGAVAQMRDMVGELNAGQRRVPAGFIAGYMFTPDQKIYDRDTVFLLAIFEDEATYRANAASLEQNAEYEQMRAMMEDDPTWMDGSFDAA